MFEHEKASESQVSISFGSSVPHKLCKFKESKDEELSEKNKGEVDQSDDDGNSS